MLGDRKSLVEESISLSFCLDTHKFGDGRGLCGREDDPRDLYLTTLLPICLNLQ